MTMRAATPSRRPSMSPSKTNRRRRPGSRWSLRVATEADGDGINPVANNFAVSAYLMATPIFDPLFAYDVNGAWVPYLAESATKIDGTNSWQIKIREGDLPRRHRDDRR